MQIKELACLLFSIFICNVSVAGLSSYGSLWLTGVLIGPFSKNNEKWKYYVEPRLVEIRDGFGLEEAHLYYGFGYQLFPHLTPYVGAAYYLSRDTAGVYLHQNVIWQQFIWDVYKTESFNFTTRVRSEERKETKHAGWAWRLRNQFTFKIPFNNTNYSLVTYDELIFNLNSPIWVSNRFLAENRYFLGIERKITKSASLDIGYLNQAKFQRENHYFMGHGAYFRLNYIS